MIRVISDSNHQLMTPDSDSPFKNLPNESGVKSPLIRVILNIRYIAVCEVPNLQWEHSTKR